MSTGISMSSVNKIKELADNGDYSLALDILEHQDLTKSLSPQFIRICGEVYYENQKYAEARAALVKAHSMAPMGNKIIFSIIKLYLSMGLFELAEHYFEIYKFNQDTRDVGTVRIEYLIAKAYRKSIIELYSILISANEMETDEDWDMEMLFLHAAMKNSDKLKTESNIFKATYKNSTKLNEIEMLLQDMEKANEYIYIYPENAVQDTDESMEETRQIEKKILDEDNLRMNPKDPKIMIMVEDDEPVPSSIKLKTMFSRSKENKKEKKERKTEEKEEKTGWFGKSRMSKKDEEAFEEAVNEMAEGDTGRQELLDEVLKPDDYIEQTEDRTSEEMVEITDTSDAADKAVYNDNVDEIAEKLFDEAIDDFSVEDEAETVVMVDVDALSNETEIVEEESGHNVFFENKEIVNTEDVSEIEEVVNAEDASKIEEVTKTNDTSEIEEATEPDETFEIEEDFGTVDEVEEFDFDSAFESLDGFELSDISETAEKVESKEEPETVIFDEDILFETKADNLGDLEYESDTDDIPVVEISETELFDDIFDESDGFESDFSDEPEPIVEVEFEEDADAESELEEPEAEIDGEPEIEEAETEAEIDDEAELEEPEAEVEIDDEPELEEAEAEVEIDGEPEAEAEIDDEAELEEPEAEVEIDDEAELEEPEAEAEIDDEAELEEAEAESEIDDEPEVEEAEPEVEPEEVESITDKEPETEEKTENILYRRNIDFPVFKTSLFPDYNRDNPPVYTPSKKKADEVSGEQEKIKENLKKEEDLLSETDRLLARLGIELGTDYHSGVDFDSHNHDSIKSHNSVQTSYTEEKADMKDKNSFKLRF